MKKLNSGESLDRVSELPESLIFEIFWLLPMREVVRTSLLSHRWKDLWTTAPYLNFEDFKKELSDADRVGKLIEGTLRSWKGTRVQKLNIEFGSHTLSTSSYSHIDSFLLRLATKYQVEELHVNVNLEYVPTFIVKSTGYRALQCLYSCSSLRRLFLNGLCNLNLPIENVNWNKLQTLEIDGYWLLSADLIHQLLSGSPKLECLKLSFLENGENLCIQSTSLKYLRIDKYLYYAYNVPSMNTELRISTPNLETLELVDVPYSKCVMNNAPSLTCLNLLFDGPYDPARKTYYSHPLFSGNDCVEETLSQILPKIQHVKSVSLSDWCIKALGDMKKRKTMALLFLKVEQLTLRGCFKGYEQIVELLEIFPQLKKLVLRNEMAYKLFLGKQQIGCRVETNLPSSFLQHLRTIVITWVENVGVEECSISPLIEILLKYGSKLEKMVFRVKQTTPASDSFFLALQKMPRSSSTAELITPF